MILPVNAPQNMIAYGTGTFEVKDFVRTGIPLTLAAFALILLLGRPTGSGSGWYDGHPPLLIPAGFAYPLPWGSDQLPLGNEVIP